MVFFPGEKDTFQSFYHMLSAWWHSDTGCGVFSLQSEDNPLNIIIQVQSFSLSERFP